MHLSYQPNRFNTKCFLMRTQKASVKFHLCWREKKNIVKSWFHILPNPSHFSANAQLFWTVICCASSWLEEALEHAVLCSAENHPISELRSRLDRRMTLGWLFGGTSSILWIWKPLFSKQSCFSLPFLSWLNMCL